MLSEFAYAKLQGINGEEYYLHRLPAVLGSKRAKDVAAFCASDQNKLEILPLTNISDVFYFHAVIFYYSGCFKLLSITPLVLDGRKMGHNRRLINAFLQGKQSVSSILQSYLKELVEKSSYEAEEEE